ncbi:MAG: GGDEF domain-containing protein [Clostridium sp.]|nr:GGDEF domain-containing protein [Clostridium sp.]
MLKIKREYLLEKVTYLILIVIGLILIGYFCIVEDDNKIENYSKAIELKDEWHIDGKDGREIQLPYNLNIPEDKGFKITRTINEDFVKNEMIICVSPYYCNINVYINDKIIYEYKAFDNGIGKSDGVVRLMIRTPEIEDMETLSIEYMPQFQLSSYEIKAPIVGEKGSVFMYYYHKGLFDTLISEMLIIIGLVTFIVHIISIKNRKIEIATLYIGLFSMLSGSYLICQIEWIHILIPNQKVLYVWECLSLSLLALPILLIVYKFIKTKMRDLLRISIIINLINFLGQLIMYCCGIMELRAMINYSHVILFFSGILIGMAIVTGKEQKALMTGLKKTVIILSMGGMAETVSYYTGGLRVGKCIKISILVFVIVQIIDNINRYRKIYDEIKENQIYQNLAYLDVLTGLSNRNSYERDLSIMENDKGNYKFIKCAMIDLNGLKAANDVYGHAAGDELIRSFGHIIRSSVDKECKSYRTGGDEFVIIFVNLSKDKVVKKLMEINNKVSSYNINSEVNISYALGIAEFSNEKHGSIKDMILEADRNMYEDKIRSKACRA